MSARDRLVRRCHGHRGVRCSDILVSPGDLAIVFDPLQHDQRRMGAAQQGGLLLEIALCTWHRRIERLAELQHGTRKARKVLPHEGGEGPLVCCRLASSRLERIGAQLLPRRSGQRRKQDHKAESRPPRKSKAAVGRDCPVAQQQRATRGKCGECDGAVQRAEAVKG
ncbi:MAG: hypothetical protein EBR10_09585 [Planctomycetes bacterium]|nr:hypothetical protein [Planctomycetota bacterium]